MLMLVLTLLAASAEYFLISSAQMSSSSPVKVEKGRDAEETDEIKTEKKIKLDQKDARNGPQVGL